MVKIKLVGGQLQVPPGTNPSGELHMHDLLTRWVNRTRAVVHVHPTHVVAAMYRGFDLQEICKDFPEIYRYTRIGPSVPGLPAISKALGEATAKALGVTEANPAGDYDIVGQAITESVPWRPTPGQPTSISNGWIIFAKSSWPAASLRNKGLFPGSICRGGGMRVCFLCFLAPIRERLNHFFWWTFVLTGPYFSMIL